MTQVDWKRIRALLIDLDGVVYTGSLAVPGAAEFLAEARRRGLPFLLVTNNSTATPEQVAERLGGMGIHAARSEILTSSEVAAAYIRERSGRGARVLVVGEAGLREAVLAQELEIVSDGQDAQWVVVGLDRAFDYARLTAANAAIRAGAGFLAANVDGQLPVEGGVLLPGAGSMVAAIATASGVAPIVSGKPESALFERALKRLGVDRPSDAAMIGDRVDTDIVGGQRAGLHTILVMTGVTTSAAGVAVEADATVPALGDVATLLGWR